MVQFIVRYAVWPLALFCSSYSYAGDWIAVDGGAVEINLRQQELENRLWQFLEQHSDYVFLERNSYTYQYQAKTKTELYINAFCDSFDKQNLHEEFLIVFDGGSCYFQISLNLETDEFTHLNVNGEA